MNKEKKQRPIDSLTNESYGWLKKSWTIVKKNDLRWWQTAFILAFFAGLFVAIITIVRLQIQTSSVASGQQAILSLYPGNISTVVGKTFTSDIILNTKGSNVVAATAVVFYNPDVFQLVSYDTANSIFAAGNSCVFENKPCQIIDNDTNSGKIVITLAKPKPGVNTVSGRIATLNFKALKAISASTIKINFTSVGDYADSNVILDDGKGTEILASVANTTVVITSPVVVCSRFTYSNWGSCQPDSTQTRTVITALPAGCTGGTQILKQSCIYQPPVVATTCTSFVYSNWSKCISGFKTRTVKSSLPAGCTGGKPYVKAAC